MEPIYLPIALRPALRPPRSLGNVDWRARRMASTPRTRRIRSTRRLRQIPAGEPGSRSAVRPDNVTDRNPAPKSHRGMVAAAVRTIFAQRNPATSFPCSVQPQDIRMLTSGAIALGQPLGCGDRERLTCPRFSRPQQCASARPHPGRSSAGLTALAGAPPGQALRSGALIGHRRPRAKQDPHYQGLHGFRGTPHRPGNCYHCEAAAAIAGRRGGPPAQPAVRAREGSRGTTLSPARPAHTPDTGSSAKPLPDPEPAYDRYPAQANRATEADFEEPPRNPLTQRGIVLYLNGAFNPLRWRHAE